MKRWRWLMVIGWLFWLPVADTDLGWHLRYGEEIIKNHRIFRENEIGFYLPEYKWAHAYGLYQVLVYMANRLGGKTALKLLGSGLMAAVFFFLTKRYRVGLGQKLAAAIYFWLTAGAVVGLGLRSQLFTILGVVWLIDLINGKRWVWIPLLFVFWVNFHGGFVLGLVILGIMAGKKWGGWLALGLSLAATLINPFGWRIYYEVWRHAWYPLNQLIAEWVGPDNLGILMIMASAVWLGMTVIVRRGRIGDRGWAVIWTFFGYLALTARRNLGIFGAISLIWFWEMGAAEVGWRWGRRLAVFGLVGLVGLKMIMRSEGWKPPAEAVGYIRESGICRNIYNAYEWGGYLDWELKDRKVFVDGRMPAWETPEGKSPYTIYLEIIQAQPGYEERLKNYGADCLLIGNGTFLDLELEKGGNQNWKKKYEDKMAAVYERSR